MILEDVREMLADVAPEAIILDNPSFDRSIIGITTEGGIVYDLEKMAEELANDDGIPLDEAYEFIDYNTLRSLGYASLQGISPTILDNSYFAIAMDRSQLED